MLLYKKRTCGASAKMTSRPRIAMSLDNADDMVRSSVRSDVTMEKQQKGSTRLAFLSTSVWLPRRTSRMSARSMCDTLGTPLEDDEKKEVMEEERRRLLLVLAFHSMTCSSSRYMTNFCLGAPDRPCCGNTKSSCQQRQYSDSSK